MPCLGASSYFPEGYVPESLIPEGYDISILEPVFADLDKAEDAGIDTLAVQMSWRVDGQGEVTMFPKAKEFFADFIIRAHEKGFRIWLNPEIIYSREVEGLSNLRRMPDKLIENTNLIENFKNAIVETAKFAEEHDVEMFSPSSEMFVNLDFEKPTRENSKKVIIDVKPRIDAVYSGKICLKGEWPNDDLFPLYSCFGPTIKLPRTEEEINRLVDNLEFQMQLEGKPEVIIAEIWEGDTWRGTAEQTEKDFERTLEAIDGKTTGVFILDSGREYTQLFPESFERVIAEFYQEF